MTATTTPLTTAAYNAALEAQRNAEALAARKSELESLQASKAAAIALRRDLRQVRLNHPGVSNIHYVDSALSELDYSIRNYSSSIRSTEAKIASAEGNVAVEDDE